MSRVSAGIVGTIAWRVHVLSVAYLLASRVNSALKDSFEKLENGSFYWDKQAYQRFYK